MLGICRGIGMTCVCNMQINCHWRKSEHATSLQWDLNGNFGGICCCMLGVIWSPQDTCMQRGYCCKPLLVQVGWYKWFLSVSSLIGRGNQCLSMCESNRNGGRWCCAYHPWQCLCNPHADKQKNRQHVTINTCMWLVTLHAKQHYTCIFHDSMSKRTHQARMLSIHEADARCKDLCKQAYFNLQRCHLMSKS